MNKIYEINGSNKKRLIFAFVDSFAIALIAFASCLLGCIASYNKSLLEISLVPFIYASLILFSITFVAFLIFNLIKRTRYYVKLEDYFLALSTYALCFATFVMIEVFAAKFVSSYMALLLAALMSCLIIVMYKIAVTYLFSRLRAKRNVRMHKRVLIIGAGYVGKLMLEELAKLDSFYQIVCLVDDDKQKQGKYINGFKVVGTVDTIPQVVKRYMINTIIFAIPNVSKETRAEILNVCLATNCDVKVLPFETELENENKFIPQIKPVNIEDLLGREPISFKNDGVSKYIENKVVFVTGGGGSIGSELCRQISRFNPKKIVIIDIYENCAYDIQQELLRTEDNRGKIFVEIASITDYDKMEVLFNDYKPTLVFHAAAHKHVPLMETNPEEAVKNNIYGTYNIALLADKYNVKKFIMCSTDKAVNPTNVMGATKRCCEMVLQFVSAHAKNTEFAAVRFGNVLNSNGSVIPLFKEQIKKGGPVTVTHKDIIRFFMTIPEAVSLVLQAGVFAKGGEIFVLDMGEPVKILTLAEKLIKLSGFEPYKDIDILFTGLRPGEKLYEELLMSEEGLKKTSNNKIFIGNQTPFDMKKFEKDLKELKQIAFTNDKNDVVKKLKEIVVTFKPEKF